MTETIIRRIYQLSLYHITPDLDVLRWQSSGKKKGRNLSVTSLLRGKNLSERVSLGSIEHLGWIAREKSILERAFDWLLEGVYWDELWTSACLLLIKYTYIRSYMIYKPVPDCTGRRDLIKQPTHTLSSSTHNCIDKRLTAVWTGVDGKC